MAEPAAPAAPTESPAAAPSALDPATLLALSAMHVRSRIIVDSALSGLHLASIRGSSVEFTEHKEYTPGDELRHLDWRAYAKSGRYYVKQFEQDSELSVYLVLDGSGSMGFAGGGASKLAYGAMLLGALAHLVVQQHDRVGLLTTGEAPRTLLAKSGAVHLREVLGTLDELIATPPKGDTRPAVGLHRIGEILQRRRGLIVLVSDLFDGSGDTLRELQQLSAQGHDVAVFHTLAPYERTFPYEGLTQFEGLESDARVLANPSVIRADYLARMQQFLDQTKSDLLDAAVGYQLIDTATALDQPLIDFLVARNGGGARPRRRRR